MKNFAAIVSLLLLLSFSLPLQAQSEKAEKIGWLLSAQTYSFRAFSFTETLDRMQKLGLKYAEVYFGQKLGGNLNGNMDYKMDVATRLQVLKLAESKGIKLIACGVVVCENAKEWDLLFDFVKAMGIKVITCEPKLDQFNYIEKLAVNNNIDIAIHNHPKPSTYWNPDVLVDVLKNKNSHFGSCADVGHWKRMGIDPVEALKKLDGRIKSLHLKDIEKNTPDSHDTVWGSGVCNMSAILKELKRQNFKGVISIEYEFNMKNPDPDMQKCIDYFYQEI